MGERVKLFSPGFKIWDSIPSVQTKVAQQKQAKALWFSPSALNQHLDPKFWTLELPPENAMQVLRCSLTVSPHRKINGQSLFSTSGEEELCVFLGNSSHSLFSRPKGYSCCHKWIYQELLVIIIRRLGRYSCGQSCYLQKAYNKALKHSQSHTAQKPNKYP